MGMRALVFKDRGIGHLQFNEVEAPGIKPDEVLVRVASAAVNPVDIESLDADDAYPIPHIPGAEFAGTVEKIGRKVSHVQKGDRVTVYPRIYCGGCRLCRADMEMMCVKGGNKIIGWDTNGGYAELVAVPKENVFPIPDRIGWDMAASLPISALTAYHAVNEANLGKGDKLVVFGASGNTGMFASQFASERGANVISVSSKGWLTEGYGVSTLIGRGNVEEDVRRLTEGGMADAVIDPIGGDNLDLSMSIANYRAKILVFGGLKSHASKINIQKLYRRELRIMGVTGGSIREFKELIEKAMNYRVHVWKTFGLEDGRKALQALHSKERDGRVMIKIG